MSWTERKAQWFCFLHPRTQTVSGYADIPEVSDLTRFHLRSHTHHASDRFPSPFQSPSAPRHVRSDCAANKKLPHESCFAQFFLRSSKKRRAIQALLSAYITLLSQKYFNLLYFSFFLKQLMKMPLLPTRA